MEINNKKIWIKTRVEMVVQQLSNDMLLSLMQYLFFKRKVGKIINKVGVWVKFKYE